MTEGAAGLAPTRGPAPAPPWRRVVGAVVLAAVMMGLAIGLDAWLRGGAPAPAAPAPPR